MRIRASSKGGVESTAGFLGKLARFNGLCMFGVCILWYDPDWRDLLLFGMITYDIDEFSSLLCFFSRCHVFLLVTACICGDSADCGVCAMPGARD